MGISEKLGYVRGLADGLNVKDNSPEGRILLAVIDLLGDMSEAMTEMGMIVQDLEESVDELIEDMYDDDDDDDDDGHISFFPGTDALDDEEDDDDEEDEDDDEGGDPCCLSCRTPIAISREMLMEGRVTCPKCGQQMLLDVQDDHGGCGGGGCCGHHHHHNQEHEDGEE